MPLVVAAIEKDHLYDGKSFDTDNAGKEFHYDAMIEWWGWGDTPIADHEVKVAPQTQFRLYDDDDELYYTGWLSNDAACMVQQFVLAWAMSDSGCITIKVLKDGEWIQEIS